MPLLFDNLMPHGVCWRGEPQLIFLYALGNSMVALAYYSIPITLAHRLWQRAPALRMILSMFMLFIASCGTSHALEVLNIWYPITWLVTWVDLFTALVSLITAAMLWPLAKFYLAVLERAVKIANREVSEGTNNARRAPGIS